jgi:hypothetical protein
MSIGFFEKTGLYPCFQRFVHFWLLYFVHFVVVHHHETIHEISRKSLYILEKPCYTEAARTSELAGIQQNFL